MSSVFLAVLSRKNIVSPLFGPELDGNPLTELPKSFSIKTSLGIYTLEPHCLVYQ